MKTAHPAKYSDTLFPYFARHLKNCHRLLDPMAGVGRMTEIRSFGFQGQIILNEIEPEWANQCRDTADFVTVADAKALPFLGHYFDAICTSPTYGNRMADHHEAKDGSKRATYRHTLGRPLHPENTGQLQWGKDYQEQHQLIWEEARRVLQPGGVLVLNISDHIRKGEIIPVSEWHRQTLIKLGFKLSQHYTVDTPRHRYGANHTVRVTHENVFVFKR